MANKNSFMDGMAKPYGLHEWGSMAYHGAALQRSIEARFAAENRARLDAAITAGRSAHTPCRPVYLGGAGISVGSESTTDNSGVGLLFTALLMIWAVGGLVVLPALSSLGINAWLTELYMQLLGHVSREITSLMILAAEIYGLYRLGMIGAVAIDRFVRGPGSS